MLAEYMLEKKASILEGKVFHFAVSSKYLERLIDKNGEEISERV